MKPISISETADKKYWVKRYEFEGMEAEAKAVALMPNGDIVIAGSIKPKEKDARSSGLVARLDREGNVKWVRILGGNKDDEFNDVKVAENGDIIVAGYTYSFGAGGYDFWVLHLDENGNIKWQKTYGGSGGDKAYALALAPNGDIIVAGETHSFGANTPNFSNLWILRLDGEGNVKWQRTFEGHYADWARAIAVAENGDFIIAGLTFSFGAGGYDAWILRLDANGNVKWQKTYGGSNDDSADAVALAPNGDIIVAGRTKSFGAGNADFWVLHLDENGNIKWQKTYGGSDSDGADALALAPNGDIIVVGYTKSFGAGSADVWILRLDENGNVKWQKTYGGSDWDYANEVAMVDSGDIIVVGYTRSFSAGDDNNVWFLRLPPDGNLPGCKLCQDSNAIVMDTQAIVKNTNCKVTVPPLKPGFFRKNYVKITDTTATVRTAVPKVEILCEWSPERRRKPWPGYLINNRYYIVKTRVIDEWALRSALEELDKELSSIDFIQPLPGEIVVYPFKGIIEGENLFVTRYIISRGPGESGIIPSKKFVEILDRIKNTAIPEIEVPEKVSRGLTAEQAIGTKAAPEISEIPKVPERAKVVEGTKTLEGFPPALLERYEPLELLGEGGFAKVFKVKSKKDGKIVALKIPRIDERTSSLFIKEVAVWYNLNHENIVRLYKADILPVPYLEMEFVEGVEVDGELFRDLGAYPKPVPEGVAIKIIRGIAEGLEHAHSKGIYHLDLKPLNVLLKADLTPKITDWGLAKISARSSLSRHYGYSPLYAAPE